MTWNPVSGCYHGCEYCYARKIAERFAGCDAGSTFGPYNHSWHRADKNTELFRGQGTAEKPMLFVLDKPLYNTGRMDKRKTEKYGRQIFTYPKAPYPFGFAPTFFRYRLDEPSFKEKPQNIFVCSTADLFGKWVPDDWIEEVFAACMKAPQHNYLFLTKNPDRYCQLANAGKLPEQDNFWYGTSVTHKGDAFFGGGHGFHTFLSIEPLLEDLQADVGSSGGVRWLIVGAMTGQGAGKHRPKREWVENILDAATLTHASVFMKSSLSSVWNEPLIQQYPKQLVH